MAQLEDKKQKIEQQKKNASQALEQEVAQNEAQIQGLHEQIEAEKAEQEANNK